jgi:sortase (surface protein transpeptidase)
MLDNCARDEARKGVPVETAPARKEAALRNGALHIEGIGLPWQRGSNVCIAGHRLGFPRTRSHLLFWDLPTLDNGDRVILEDSQGWTYEYAAFRKLVVSRLRSASLCPCPARRAS